MRYATLPKFQIGVEIRHNRPIAQNRLNFLSLSPVRLSQSRRYLVVVGQGNDTQSGPTWASPNRAGHREWSGARRGPPVRGLPHPSGGRIRMVSSAVLPTTRELQSSVAGHRGGIKTPSAGASPIRNRAPGIRPAYFDSKARTGVETTQDNAWQPLACHWAGPYAPGTQARPTSLTALPKGGRQESVAVTSPAPACAPRGASR